MKLHEYQAKEIFAAYGIPIQKGAVVERPEQVEDVALAYPVVLKAQVLVGGRGKAGGIKVARTPDEARERAAQILGMTIKGEAVRRLLVVEAAEIGAEYYLAFTVDRAARRLVAIASAAGGVDIEDVARTTPEKIVKHHVDPTAGFHPYNAREMGRALGFGGKHLLQFAAIAHGLWRICAEMDAELAEINPLAKVDDSLLAIDAKLIIDDNATFRHEGLPRNEELTELEAAAQSQDLSYVELDGDVAIIGNGAGLVMSTLDMIAHFGGRPANFLDVGGGATTENMSQAMSIVLRKSGVRALFVNIFGGITRCDDIARAIAAQPPAVPMVVRLTGTNEEEGRMILQAAGIHALTDPESAAQEAVRLAAGAQ
ncbi:MAG: ADP-forming succinate--CoA ligase subunit beta [Armatimonadetes bacterium]|nr:ADP-forming succinate--CoA ligase subunit beta [Armatimonadota bacterium]